MNKVNKVFYPRLAGIGDLMPALSMMIHYFKGEPFTIVAGKITPNIREHSPHYVGFYKQLCSAVTSCQGLEILGHLSEEQDADYVDQAKDDNSVNWLIMSDESPDAHGYKYWGKNIYEIMQMFGNSFEPEAQDSLNALFNKDKVNICFQLRKAKISDDKKNSWHHTVFDRNVDLAKWAKLISWLADDDQFNLIAIGESDPNSPWFISLDEIPELVGKNNIKLAPWDLATSLSDDMFIIKNCDIFLGTHSGPQQVAWNLAKPAICFDYKRRDQATVYGVERHHCSIFQKICWGEQSLDEMKELWLDYYNDVYTVYKDMNLIGVIEKHFEIYDYNYSQMLDLLEDKVDIDKHSKIKKRKITRQRAPKNGDVFSFVAAYSYRAAQLCIDNGLYDLAIKFLKETWGYSGYKPEQAIEIASVLKQYGYAEFQISYMRKYIFYLNSLLNKKGFALANNYLINEYISTNRADEILNYYMNVFGVLGEHLPTLELMKKASEAAGDAEGVKFYNKKIQGEH